MPQDRQTRKRTQERFGRGCRAGIDYLIRVLGGEIPPPDDARKDARYSAACKLVDAYIASNGKQQTPAPQSQARAVRFVHSILRNTPGEGKQADGAEGGASENTTTIQGNSDLTQTNKDGTNG